MAGDWIKMRCDLGTDPAVISIAEACSIDEDLVVGKLHKLWSWASRECYADGNGRVTVKFVDRFLNVPGFAAAMQKAGWLVLSDAGISFPKFDLHNTKSAKERALAAIRVQRFRNANRNGNRNGDVNGPVTEAPALREEYLNTSAQPKGRAENARWLGPYAQAWEEKLQGPFPVKPSLRPLANLRGKHGDETVLPIWKFYLAEKREYASAANFAEHFGVWRQKYKPPPTKAEDRPFVC